MAVRMSPIPWTRALVSLRKRIGMNMGRWARYLHMQRTSWRNIENGNGSVTLETLERVARMLDIPLWCLVRYAEVEIREGNER